MAVAGPPPGPYRPRPGAAPAAPGPPPPGGPASPIRLGRRGRAPADLGFDPSVFVYLVYEPTRQQRAWHFEVDLDPFDPDLLAARDIKACQVDPLPPLCIAAAYAASPGGA